MSIELIGLDNIPLVEPNDDVCQIIKDEIENNKGDFTEQDSTNNVNIPLLEKQTPLTSESQTNFFDKIFAHK